MKRKFLTLVLAAFTVGLLGSCAKINDRIDELENRIGGIESERIASIDSQIGSIKSSIADLDIIRTNIQSLTSTTASQGDDITALRSADEALGSRIVELKSYVEENLKNYAKTEWVNATFSTLDQYTATCDTIARIDARIGALDVKLSQDIEDCADSLKSWINVRLGDYYTIAQLDATVATLQAAIDTAKIESKAKADSIAAELAATKTAIDTAKAAIRSEYRSAINTAITTLDGKLSKALADSIAAVNAQIKILTDNVSSLQSDLDTLADRVTKLENMIQSVVIIPAYSDGSVEIQDGNIYIDCIINPVSAVESLTKDSVKVLVNKVITKASGFEDVPLVESDIFKKDDTKGTISLKVNIADKIPATSSDSTITVAVKVKNGISDYTTEFVPVTVNERVFKAVYNPNGDVDTLTFYYDDKDHGGEGITVYDGKTNYLFDNSKSNGEKWGYNANRGEIDSVVIDASVAGYKGLTSTAFMFGGMTNATGISGAEYLDVSNVTDMSAMFYNFGGGANDSPTTLNSVPDVSGWDTGNVTNMAGMFWGYGNFSSELDTVPDVSGWNTGEVTNMSNMFQKYGHESLTFNAVPDVSNWDTGNVTDMANIFNEYGYKSTELDTVPNVSNWKTNNVKRMQQMFYNYGTASIKISCVLDLSGWDLSKITGTSGNNVFKFTPSTFNVTIPAKTGEKFNEVEQWYYGDGTNYIAPPTGKTFTLPTN